MAPALAVACSLALEAEETQCSTDADCSARGFTGATCEDSVCKAPVTTDAGADSDASDAPSDPKWGCIGKITWASPDTSASITLVSRFLKLVGETPIADMDVRACARLDVNCSQPVATAKTDSDGKATMKLFKGFDGYTLAAPPASFPEMMPAILLNVPPPTEDELEPSEPVHLTSKGEINAIGALVQKQLEPGMGHVFGLALDCQGKPTAGVTLKVDTVSPSTIGYYVASSGLPSATLGETSARGEAGYLNLPPGYVTITATSVDKGKVGSVTALIKPDHITYVPLPPTP